MNEAILIKEDPVIPLKFFVFKIFLELILIYGLNLHFGVSSGIIWFLISFVAFFNFIGILITAPVTMKLGIVKVDQVYIIKSYKLVFGQLKIPYILNNFHVKDFRLVQTKSIFRKSIRYLFIFKIKGFRYKIKISSNQMNILQRYLPQADEKKIRLFN